MPSVWVFAFDSQLVGTAVAAVSYLGTAWYMIENIPGICDQSVLPPNSPWTCPGDRVFFDASVIWGLIGPRRIFGDLGLYSSVNWFFVIGAVAPLLVWLACRRFPNQRWIRLINMPILIGATGMMPPATAVNFTSWCLMGFLFSFVIFRYRKAWWQRYNYVLSGGLDAGLAFMGIMLYIFLGWEDISLQWWGANLDNCPFASCPTAPGIEVYGCPAFS
jgi:OPT family oligopeptide transporter